MALILVGQRSRHGQLGPLSALKWGGECFGIAKCQRATASIEKGGLAVMKF